MSQIETIGLALSGGGVRAAIFHLGALKWLAENNQLENIKHLSTVSGGTLVTGLIFYLNNYVWPCSNVYLTEIHPKLCKIFTHSDLQLTLVKKTFNPFNWSHLLSRANILAKAIEECWGIRGMLSDVKSHPIWTINGTTFENGRRFRFKQNTCGDYELGYASADNFKLIDVMAMSAAVPHLIGPLMINPHSSEWRKSKNWDDHKDSQEIIQLPFKKLHLYDGGLYDNLGLEPLFDAGTQTIKDNNISKLLVSDAGQPLLRQSVRGNLNRYLRTISIISDQSRSLRVRAISNYFITNKGAGLYFQITSDPVKKIQQYRHLKPHICEKLLSQSWLSIENINRAANYPTTLRKVTPIDFDLIERHGYETAKWNSLIFS
ncbi:patatin-like phospholipase family protein [Legionella feeleii]|uniref:Patatin-like phospholipase n=1 Tax=Legionella feeleii TaxID=453 RepID=A0A378IYL9_9GAMM|nr:patatin-like phospholipase family protein [Legionella feeleii]STX39581.1 Patatin-like phospholipase [Legionella feeleii]